MESSASTSRTSEQIEYSAETDATHNTKPKLVEFKSRSLIVRAIKSVLPSQWFKKGIPSSSGATFDFVSEETDTSKKTYKSADGADNKFNLLSNYDVVTVRDIIGTENHVSSQDSSTETHGNLDIALQNFFGELYGKKYCGLNDADKELESYIMEGNHAVLNKPKNTKTKTPFEVLEKLDAIAKNVIKDNAIKDNAIKDKASSVIKKAYKQHRVRVEAKIAQANATPARQSPESKFGLVTMIKKDDSQETPVETTYYFDVKGKIPPVRPPKNVDENFETIRGGSKKMIAADDEFVLLKDKRGVRQSKTKVQLMELQRELSKYSAISRTVPISDDSAISVKGGDEIEKYYIRKDKTIPISAFRNICENVALAHKEQCYFNDLKPKNMTFRSELIGKGKKVKLDDPQANLIDVDDFVSKDNATAEKRMAGGTPTFLTIGLYNGKQSGNHELWRAADNYALLLSVATSTSVEVGIAMYDRETYNKFQNKKTHNIPTKGYMEYGHQETFGRWVQDFIKPEHQTNVLKFLAAPEVHPLAENVIDVIKWDK